jgi:hypothetical protein
MAVWLVFLVLVILALVALVALAVGGLLGVFVGGLIGGVRGGVKAPEEGKELATYRGITWGGCLGAVVGLALTLLLLFLAWNYLLSVNS